MLIAGLLVLLVAIALAGVVLVRWFSQRSKLRAQAPRPTMDLDDESGPEFLRPFRPVVRGLAGLTRQLPMLRIKEYYAHQIERAGLPFELSADEFLAIKAACLVVMAGFALLVYTVLFKSWPLVIAVC